MSDKHPEEPQPHDLSRRKALRIIVGSASAAVTLPVLSEAADSLPICHAPIAAQAPSSQPDFTPKFFVESQLKTIDALSETIIPTDGHSPGASVAKVYQYVDEIVSSSIAQTKNLWTDGLTRINKMARDKYGKDFAACSGEQQMALLEGLSRNEDQPASPEEKFFVAVKRAPQRQRFCSSRQKAGSKRSSCAGFVLAKLSRNLSVHFGLSRRGLTRLRI